MSDTSEILLRWVQVPGSPGSTEMPDPSPSPGFLYYFGPTQEAVFTPAPAPAPPPFDQTDRTASEQVLAAAKAMPGARCYTRDQVYAISGAMVSVLTIGGHGDMWAADDDAGFAPGRAGRLEKLEAAVAILQEQVKGK